MLRFAANLSFLFTELPFRARFAAAAMSGFAAVEYLFPYEYEPDELAGELKSHDLTQALFNLPPGDWEAGERGLAALPGREAEFEASVGTALRYAEALGCGMLHVMGGIPPADVSAERAFETVVGNLKRACEAAGATGVDLVIEPINARDMPGYYLSRTADARRIIDAVGADNLGLQLDLYHRQVSEGDLVHAIRDNADITRHIQVANPPERADPGYGEIDYELVFQEIAASGYKGWIGCEYRPRTTTRESLDWFAPYRRDLA